jgi:hypothetical protein
MFSHYDYPPQDHGHDPATEERAALADRFGGELLEGRTRQQQEITGRIYEELKAGAHVDDIKHLIGQLSRTATEDARNRDARWSGGGRR